MSNIKRPIVLVTGIGRTVGIEIARKALDNGFEVIGIDSELFFPYNLEEGDYADRLDALTLQYGHQQLNIINIPINENEFYGQGLKALLDSYKERDLQAIFLVDEQPYINYAELNSNVDFRHKVQNTNNLLLEIAEQGHEKVKVIMMSSYHVFGDAANGIPTSEYDERIEIAMQNTEEDRDKTKHLLGYTDIEGINNLMRPSSSKSIYAYHKTMQEELVSKFAWVYGWPTTIIRYSEVIEQINELLFSETEYMPLINSAILDAAQNAKIYSQYYDGKMLVDYIDAVDVAGSMYKVFEMEMHKEMIGANPDPNLCRTYVFGGGYENTKSYLEIVAMLSYKYKLNFVKDFSRETYLYELALQPILWFSDNTDFLRSYPYQLKKTASQSIFELFEHYSIKIKKA